MQLSPFKIQLNSEITIIGEIEGNPDSGKAIIFSHGFGVKRDSHGMFNQIGDYFNDQVLVVRFDYTLVDTQKNSTTLFPLSIQKAMLLRVSEYIKAKYNCLKLYLIAHSLGCLIPAMIDQRVFDRIILLAGPVANPFNTLINYFSNREDTIIDLGGVSRIKRSDGSTSIVSSDCWQEIKNVRPISLYRQLSQLSKVVFVRALDDEVLNESQDDFRLLKSAKSIVYYEIKGNHDFSNARAELINLINETVWSE